MARKLNVERDKIRAEVRKQSDQEYLLEEAEKEQQIAEMRRQIDDLKRKAEQGSQRLQGEVQELALEELLRSAFAGDGIEPAAKEICGGVSLHKVFDATGLTCGTILWEPATLFVLPALYSLMVHDRRPSAEEQSLVTTRSAFILGSCIRENPQTPLTPSPETSPGEARWVIRRPITIQSDNRTPSAGRAGCRVRDRRQRMSARVGEGSHASFLVGNSGHRHRLPCRRVYHSSVASRAAPPEPHLTTRSREKAISIGKVR